MPASSQGSAASATTSPPRGPKPKPWKSIDAETVRAVVPTFCHFTAKAVHSQVPTCAVRIVPARQDLPYVGVSTLAPGTVPLDYATGARAAPILAQYAAATGAPKAPPFESIPDGEAAVYRDAAAVLEHGGEIGTGIIDNRLRQILWPVEPDGVDEVASAGRTRGADEHRYHALTPLSSTGLATVVRDRAQAARLDDDGALRFVDTDERWERRPRWRRAALPVGGTKPWNVGRLMLGLQRPLLVDGPRRAAGERAVWQTHYRGLDWFCASVQIRAWRSWRASRRRETGPSNAAARAREQRMIASIARVTLAIAAEHRRGLEDRLGADAPLVIADIDPVSRALVDARLRTDDWPRRFARALIERLVHARFDDGSRLPARLGLAEPDARTLQATLEEIARAEQASTSVGGRIAQAAGAPPDAAAGDGAGRAVDQGEGPR